MRKADLAWLTIVIFLILISVFTGLAFWVYVQTNEVEITVNHVITTDQDLKDFVVNIPEFNAPSWLDKIQSQISSLKGGV